MFHEDEGSVDVELLAECGAIAQRLRSLERTWFIELKDLQRKSLRGFSKPLLPSSDSVLQKLNEIFEIDEHSTLVDNKDRNDPEFVNRLKSLEEAVINIHNQQEILKQQKRATSDRKVHIESNMNYSAAATKSNNNDLTTSPTDIHELKDDQQFEIRSHSCASGIASSWEDHNYKSLTNDDADSQNDHSMCHHQQQQLRDEISSDDLKMLLKELKRKVDFTEKMNWLCKFRT